MRARRKLIVTYGEFFRQISNENIGCVRVLVQHFSKSFFRESFVDNISGFMCNKMFLLKILNGIWHKALDIEDLLKEALFFVNNLKRSDQVEINPIQSTDIHR